MAVFEKGHALIVGVGADLAVTIQDAKGIANFLKDEERCAYPIAQVNLLTSEGAKRNEVLAGLKKLADECTEESMAVIYFSGHGYEINTGFGKMYFLMPYGYESSDLVGTAISGREFVDHVKAIPAKKKLILLDCCHAGGFSDAAKDASAPAMTKAPIPPEAVSLLEEGSGVVLIASSQADELSYTGSPYSAFTLAILESLSGVGVAEKDGYVRATDIALHAREVVPSRTEQRQHPILNFKDADNFRVAYYAAGDVTPKGLPFDVSEIKIDNEPEAPAQSTTINTGGGAYIGGSVNTGGGSFVGRDSYSIGNVGAGAAVAQGQGASAQVTSYGSSQHSELDALLQSLLAQLKNAPSDKKGEADEVGEYAKEFVDEVKSEKPRAIRLNLAKESLIKAAENLEAVMPAVIRIARMIIGFG